MEQLFAAFGINWKLLLVQAVNFGLLLFALTYLLYRPVLRIIDARREKIAESVRVADEAARTLDDAKVESDKMVGDAARRAEGLVAAARARSEDLSSESMKEAQARADELLREAAARAEEASRKTLAESEREIARLGLLAAEKILRGKA